MRCKLISSVILAGCLTLLGLGCGGGNGSTFNNNDFTLNGSRLQASDTNLVFVVTPDLAHNAGDINPRTANLSNQGLQRALLLARYLKTSLLNSANPNSIYALEPGTRLQNSFPDMVPLEIMEQFALLNQSTLVETPPTPNVVASSFPVKVSYSAASLPAGAATPPTFDPACQGIDFADVGRGNEALVNGIIAQRAGGFYLFALPFETLQSLLSNLKTSNSFAYQVPTTWEGPNTLYVLTIPSGPTAVALRSHDTHLAPGTTFPTPIPPYQPAANLQTPFVLQPSTVSGSSLPANIGKNQTLYFVRHGEAHPTSDFENGNLVMPGNWRALYLPGALAGKFNPLDFLYTVDPAQAFPGMNNSTNSYVRPSMTIAPYAIANGMPLNLVTGVRVGGLTPADDDAQVAAAVQFFFFGGQFSGKTLLVAWEHVHIREIAQALVSQYFVDPSLAPPVPPWPGDSPDYDTIWTFRLDGNGNLTISNQSCEGIDSPTLPSVAPIF